MSNCDSHVLNNKKDTIVDDASVTVNKCEQIKDSYFGNSKVKKSNEVKTVSEPTVIYLSRDIKSESKSSLISTSQSTVLTLCPFCDYTCIGPTNLKAHMLNHAGEKLYQCTICLKVYSEQILLKRHILTHDSGARFGCSNKKPDFQKKTSCTFNGYSCRDCDYKTQKQYNFKLHSLVHKKTLPLLCRICGKECSSKWNLAQHEHAHAKKHIKYMCQDCNYETRKKSNLDRHCRNHQKKQHLICKICGIVYGDRGNFVKHEQTHYKKMLFKCTGCDYSSITSKKLQEHKQRYHRSNSKTYPVHYLNKTVCSNENSLKKKPCSDSNSRVRNTDSESGIKMLSIVSEVKTTNSKWNLRSTTKYWRKLNPEVVDLSD